MDNITCDDINCYPIQDKRHYSNIKSRYIKTINIKNHIISTNNNAYKKYPNSIASQKLDPKNKDHFFKYVLQLAEEEATLNFVTCVVGLAITRSCKYDIKDLKLDDIGKNIKMLDFMLEESPSLATYYKYEDEIEKYLTKIYCFLQLHQPDSTNFISKKVKDIIYSLDDKIELILKNLTVYRTFYYEINISSFIISPELIEILIEYFLQSSCKKILHLNSEHALLAKILTLEFALMNCETPIIYSQETEYNKYSQHIFSNIKNMDAKKCIDTFSPDFIVWSPSSDVDVNVLDNYCGTILVIFTSELKLPNHIMKEKFDIPSTVDKKYKLYLYTHIIMNSIKF